MVKNHKCVAILLNLLQDYCVLNIGLDDTDSPSGMCTTYLAYKIAAEIRKEDAEFLDYPRLVRLNPNIPWKTRGNGAVSMRVRTKNPKRVKGKITELVKRHSDTRRGANPGLVFYENSEIPPEFRDFSEAALRRLIPRGSAKKFAARHNLDTFHLGNGQGLVGAIGAIGYRFDDSTAELLCYRKKAMFGKKRAISPQSVREMQDANPQTFGSYDAKKKRVLMAPRGPDPVFYGLRGETPLSVWRASKAVEFDEKLEGHMIFRSNQGTGDHLKSRIDVRRMDPYASGTVEGTVSRPPVMHAGGHATFSLNSDGVDVRCAVYKPTGLSSVAMDLIVGDKIRIGGGVRKSTRRHPRVVNTELIEVQKLSSKQIASNPPCRKCGKNMKSKGRSQGFSCVRCNTHAARKTTKRIPRDLRKGQYVPVVSAHRHLTRPVQRLGKSNKIRFDGSVPWFASY